LFSAIGPTPPSLYFLNPVCVRENEWPGRGARGPIEDLMRTCFNSLFGASPIKTAKAGNKSLWLSSSRLMPAAVGKSAAPSRYRSRGFSGRSMKQCRPSRIRPTCEGLPQGSSHAATPQTLRAGGGPCGLSSAKKTEKVTCKELKFLQTARWLTQRQAFQANRGEEKPKWSIGHYLWASLLRLSARLKAGLHPRSRGFEQL
jgi:hypothetical protein